MNLTFACPRCERPARLEVAESARKIDCPHCAAELPIPANAWVGGRLTRCLVCPCKDLFLRKDFPQRLGVGIVAVGLIGSTIAWYFYWIYTAYGILFATALLDVVLYWVVGQALVCYRCGAHYRGLAGLTSHAPFNLETHERYRQEAARLG